MTVDTLLQKYDKYPIKGDIYNKKNLHYYLDFLLTDILVHKGHTVNNFNDNLKLICSFLSSLLILITSLIVSFYDFSNVKMNKFTFMFLVIYFVFYLTYNFVNYFDRGYLYFTTFDIFTSISNEGEYTLILYFKSNSELPKKYSKSVCDLFYEDGLLDHKMFISEIDEKMTEIFSIKNN